jgi:hypothetical protein
LHEPSQSAEREALPLLSTKSELPSIVTYAHPAFLADTVDTSSCIEFR